MRRVLTPTERSDRALSRMAPGTLGGRLESASPLMDTRRTLRTTPRPSTGALRYSTVVVAPSDSLHTADADVTLPGGDDTAALADAASDAGPGELLVLDGTVKISDFVSGARLRGMGGPGPGTTIQFDYDVGDGIELLNFGEVLDLYIDGTDGGGGSPSSNVHVIKNALRVEGVVCNLADGASGCRFISAANGRCFVSGCDLSGGDLWTMIYGNTNSPLIVSDNLIQFFGRAIESRGDHDQIALNKLFHGDVAVFIASGAAGGMYALNRVRDCGERDGNGGPVHGALQLEGSATHITDNDVSETRSGAYGLMVALAASSSAQKVYNNDFHGAGIDDPGGSITRNMDGSANDWNL